MGRVRAAAALAVVALLVAACGGGEPEGLVPAAGSGGAVPGGPGAGQDWSIANSAPDLAGAGLAYGLMPPAAIAAVVRAQSVPPPAVMPPPRVPATVSAAPSPSPSPTQEPAEPRSPAPQPPAEDPDPPASAPTPPRPSGLPAAEAELVALVNQARAENDLDPLSVRDDLTAHARSWSAEMAAAGELSHDELTIPSGCDGAGENVAGGGFPESDLAQAMFDAWMDSEGHRANILSDSFTAIGVGFAEDSDGGWWGTQNFAAC